MLLTFLRDSLNRMPRVQDVNLDFTTKSAMLKRAMRVLLVLNNFTARGVALVKVQAQGVVKAVLNAVTTKSGLIAKIAKVTMMKRDIVKKRKG